MPRFGGVLKLFVVTFTAYFIPAFRFEPFDDFSAIHVCILYTLNEYCQGFETRPS